MMNSRGTAIRYGDVAPEAKENFIPTASESEFDTLTQLQQYNLNFPNYANPCELYQIVLEGTATAFPSVPEQANLGLWSKQISNDDGTFTAPISLTLASEGQYSSQGFTFTFDTDNQIYATSINIHWWRDVDGTLTDLGEETFTPDDAFYFCHKQVENYNRVIITFYSINMPKNRLKLRAIDYGYGTYFYGNEIRHVKIIQEIDPISTQISINTADFTLDSKSNIEYSFQKKQPLSIYFNGELKATTFVRTSKRQARFLWQIKSEDYIGVMDSVPYYGGMYAGQDAYDLLTDIFSTAKVPYAINENLKGVLLYGYIPYTTCREALMQVTFAVQNVVDTSNSDVVNVYALEDDIKQTIPLSRIMQGQNFSDEETVTGVEVTAHAYKAITEAIDVYEATENGIGENILVKFSEPLHDLVIINGDFVTDDDGNDLIGANFAIINARSGCKLTGEKYEHTTQVFRRNREDVGATTLEKVVAIDNATLVSQYNIEKILDNCYDWLIRTNTTNLKIVEGKHIQSGGMIKWGARKWGTFKWGEKTSNFVTYDSPVNVGDNINAATEYLGVIAGRVIKQSFNLNGGIIIKEAILK